MLLNTSEASRFESLAGPLFEAFTIFPLHGIGPDGRCLCRKPACENHGKHPAIKWGVDHFPDGSKMARRDDGVGVGTGLATGSRSGGVFVLDLDVKPGQNGIEALAELEQVYGRLPRTLAVETPSGSRHLYFRTAARIQSNASVIGIGIDVRGEGGYVVLPGSPHARGGTYKVSAEYPIATLPAAWVVALPHAGDRATSSIVPDQFPTIEPSTLRQRLADHVKGKKGPEAAIWRRVVEGERMFRIEGGPGDPSIPLVHGVDEFVCKSLIWPLAHSDEWFRVAPQDFGTLLAPSLALLRQDAGPSSKWTPEHAGQKWAAACAKAAAGYEESEARIAGLLQAAALSKDAPLPFVVQVDDRYYVLDDRTNDPTYEGPIKTAAVAQLAAQIWGGRRVLEIDGKNGTRDMTPQEIVKIYGRIATELVIDYTATTPRMEDLAMVRGPTRKALPEPRHDPAVQAWIETLAGDALDPFLDWIVWAAADKCGATVPALTLIGGAHVGKGLVADGLAAAAGLNKAAPLKRVLGQFGSILAKSPILFADEGLPRNGSTGQPMTEEFRSLVTATTHVTELKGSDRPLMVRGGVRVILAANSIGRLFSNRGNLGGDDVAALLRRLLVVQIHGAERIALATAQARGLGRFDGDPARAARVAGHFRWIQTTRIAPLPPEPRAGSVGAELRTGGDQVRAALQAIEDRIGSVEWIAVDRSLGLLWIRPDMLARACESQGGPGPLMRALGPLTRYPSRQARIHPVALTPLPDRQRWAALDLDRLVADGIDLTGPDKPATVPT